MCSRRGAGFRNPRGGIWSMSIFAGVPVPEKFAHDHPGSALTVIISSVRFVNATLNSALLCSGQTALPVAAAAPRVAPGESEGVSDPPHPASKETPMARAEQAARVVRCIVCTFEGSGPWRWRSCTVDESPCTRDLRASAARPEHMYQRVPPIRTCMRRDPLIRSPRSTRTIDRPGAIGICGFPRPRQGAPPSCLSAPCLSALVFHTAVHSC
jgi:hypothetical protein